MAMRYCLATLAPQGIHGLDVLAYCLAPLAPASPSRALLVPPPPPPSSALPPFSPPCPITERRLNLVALSPAVEVVLQGVPVHPVLNPSSQGDEFGLLMTMPYRQELGGGCGRGRSSVLRQP